MPIVGEGLKQNSKLYANPMDQFASQFLNTVTAVRENGAVDLFETPHQALLRADTRQELKDLFVSECVDRNEFLQKHSSALEREDQIAMFEQQFENDAKAIQEHTSASSFNPVIGMTFPIHKNILMNNVFDKVIPKFVATTPRWTESMETRIMVDREGNEIDMFKEQHKIYDVMINTIPFKDVVVPLPEDASIDIVKDIFKAPKENLSTASNVSAVCVKSFCENGDKFYDFTDNTEKAMTDALASSLGSREQAVWKKIKPERFTPGYGEFSRQIMFQVKVQVKVSEDNGVTVTTKEIIGSVFGKIDANRVSISSPNTEIKAVNLAARLETSSATMATPTVRWKVRTDVFEIDDAIPVNTTVSPEELKDISALYQVNQVTKLMTLFKTVLGEFKDRFLRAQLDDSFNNMAADSKLTGSFDFAPREQYALDHITYRHATFMDALDTHVTKLIQVLNDPNMTVSIVGRPDIIRKIAPQEYTYQTPSNVGPVQLDFVRTVTTSEKRLYQFVSSDKLRGNNNLIVILCPRNTDRIVYRVYDYQMFVSNEIRNAANPSLPAIHAFERFKFVEYQPVQARIMIFNPTGLRTHKQNTDPIGPQGMRNDFDTATGFDADLVTTP